MTSNDDYVLQLLMERGYLTEEQVGSAVDAMKAANETALDVLLKGGAVDQDTVLGAIATQFGIKYCHLELDAIDPGVTKVVTGKVARKYGVVPIVVDEDSVTVALSDPMGFDAIDYLRFVLAGKDVQVVLCPPDEVKVAMAKLYEPPAPPIRTRTAPPHTQSATTGSSLRRLRKSEGRDDSNQEQAETFCVQPRMFHMPKNKILVAVIVGVIVVCAIGGYCGWQHYENQKQTELALIEMLKVQTDALRRQEADREAAKRAQFAAQGISLALELARQESMYNNRNNSNRSNIDVLSALREQTEREFNTRNDERIRLQERERYWSQRSTW